MREYYTRDEVRDAAVVGVQAVIEELAGPMVAWIGRLASKERANLNSEDIESLNKIHSDGVLKISVTVLEHLVQIGKLPDPTLSVEEIIENAKEEFSRTLKQSIDAIHIEIKQKQLKK